MIADIGNIEYQVPRQRALDGEVPTLDIGLAEMRVDDEVGGIRIGVGNNSVGWNNGCREGREPGLECRELSVWQHGGAEAAIAAEGVVLLHGVIVGVGVVRERSEA